MTALTNKQRVKTNAALTIIHSSGGDASAVTAHAKQLQALGHPARSAYEIALTSAVAAAPELSAEIERSLRLIEASDHATVALYDHALTSYNETGSETELQALRSDVREIRDALVGVRGSWWILTGVVAMATTLGAMVSGLTNGFGN